MHLEDVNVEGFKSFSEPTGMSFQPGIGVIIGNNGVGKSNILDAIVWALGEDSLLRIRCLEPGEIFFAGSRQYPPAQKVRVELVFKEGTGKETSVVLKAAREMDQGGRKSFYINDTACAVEEYLEELAARRLSETLKTIIRQEQINDSLLLDPQERFDWLKGLIGIHDDQVLAALVEKEIAPLFQEYFHCLVPLGEAELKMVDLQHGRIGLDLQVTLTGGRERKAHQLSGGEKSVTSLALKLAVFEQLESLFYLFDEVEPSLDYSNHKSMQTLLRNLAQKKQLIMVTHLRSTIELANTLHGVRTRFDGSSFMKFYFVMDKRLLRLYKCC